MSDVSIEVRCPACSHKGLLMLEENLIRCSKSGITAINVAEVLICKHSFVVYVDKNLAIRDSFITDFRVQLPQIKIEERKKSSDDIEEKEINLYLLLINLSAKVLTWSIRSCFLNKKMVIVNELELLKPQFEKIMRYSFKNSFEWKNVSIINKSEYIKDKKKYKDCLIVENQKISNDKRKNFISSKIKIESTIIQKLLAETDEERGLIIFKNEIFKAYKMCGEIMKILENIHGKEKLAKKEVIIKLNEIYNIEISFEYFEFLIEIIENYFKFDLSNLSKHFFPSFGI